MANSIAVSRFYSKLPAVKRVCFDVRWLWTVLPGVCIVGWAFRETFQDLFHPTQSGSLSTYVGRTMFGLLRRWPSLLSMAGPLTLVIVILSWAFLQALGFALIDWFGYPSCFRIQGEHPGGLQGFSVMFYFSLEILTTLGLGDVLPVATWLRLLCTFEALVGFSLVTASVSSLLLLFPALSRMRSLASRTQTLLKAQHSTGIDLISAGGDRLLTELALDVITARVDFIHFPIVYYFHAERMRSSLPHALPHLLRLADLGSRPDLPERVRLAAATLQTALHDLGQVLSIRFIHGDPDDTNNIFRVYAEKHSLGKGANQI
jgi:hypothetical protein